MPSAQRHGELGRLLAGLQARRSTGPTMNGVDDRDRRRAPGPGGDRARREGQADGRDHDDGQDPDELAAGERPDEAAAGGRLGRRLRLGRRRSGSVTSDERC